MNKYILYTRVHVSILDSWSMNLFTMVLKRQLNGLLVDSVFVVKDAHSVDSTQPAEFWHRENAKMSLMLSNFSGHREKEYSLSRSLLLLFFFSVLFS